MNASNKLVCYIILDWKNLQEKNSSLLGPLKIKKESENLFFYNGQAAVALLVEHLINKNYIIVFNFFKTYEWVQQARVFFPYNHFQPSVV
jgi:hypothetical protein